MFKCLRVRIYDLGTLTTWLDVNATKLVNHKMSVKCNVDGGIEFDSSRSLQIPSVMAV